jgi:hypothetical protein
MPVLVEDAAQPVPSADIEVRDLFRVGNRFREWAQRRGSPESPVGPVLVIEMLKLPERAQKVALVPDERAVQELVAARLYPAFHDRIHSRHLDAAQDDLEPGVPEHGVKTSYRLLSVSYAELYRDVRGCGKIGRYLVDELVEFNSERSFAGYSPERHCLGDSAAVGVVLNLGCGWHSERPAPAVPLRRELRRVRCSPAHPRVPLDRFQVRHRRPVRQAPGLRREEREQAVIFLREGGIGVEKGRQPLPRQVPDAEGQCLIK